MSRNINTQTNMKIPTRKNFLKELRHREIGYVNKLATRKLPKTINNALNQNFQKIHEVTNGLAAIIDSCSRAPQVDNNKWIEIGKAVNQLITTILDNTNPDLVFSISPSKREQREIFVCLGGMHLLLRLFRLPFCESDCRKVLPDIFQQRSEIWNEILVILREVCFAVPPIADSIFSKDHIVTLFTMLSHQPIFENAMTLLEEVLAVRVETFNLSEIPKFYSLIEKFSSRQLSHFCRVLALVLFEPEDRQIMECSQLLRSFELLQLRRDRMAKTNNIVEFNQSLIVEMPGLLNKFIILLKVMNFGPSISQLIQHNIVQAVSLTSDLLSLISNNDDGAEWQHLTNLLHIAKDPNSTSTSSSTNNRNTNNNNASINSSSSSSSRRRSRTQTVGTNTTNTQQLSTSSAGGGIPSTGSTRSAFTPTRLSSSTSINSYLMEEDDLALVDMNQNEDGQSIVQNYLVNRSMSTESVSTGINSGRNSNVRSNSTTTNGGSPQNNNNENTNAVQDPFMENLLRAFSNTDTNTGFHPLNHMMNILHIAGDLQMAAVQDRGPAIFLSAITNPSATSAINVAPLQSSHGQRRRHPAEIDARKELQFHSMSLVQHQVELLFVLCTLLSGRRKIDVQQKVAQLGLADVLRVMFSRLSWETPSRTTPIMTDHMHGPGCECNPESAFRVQYLRLVHNFYDRDFFNNPNKHLLLSGSELQAIHSGIDTLRGGFISSGEDQGLLNTITYTLLRESNDSIYRFWLSSCIEAYLRGSGPAEQIFVSRSGILNHLVSHVLSCSLTTTGNLQTVFDLLGEITKSNSWTVELLEQSLVGNQFQVFMDVVLSNLVDSNVFLRSLYLTMEKISTERIIRNRTSNNNTKVDLDKHYDNNDYLSVQTDENKISSTSASHGNQHRPMKVEGTQKMFKNSHVIIGYLTHSWIQFTPILLSKRAIDCIVPHTIPSKGASKGCRSSRPPAPFAMGTSALSTISEGVIDAFRGLRDAASQLLTTNSNNSISSNNISLNASNSNSSSSQGVSQRRSNNNRSPPTGHPHFNTHETGTNSGSAITRFPILENYSNAYLSNDVMRDDVGRPHIESSTAPRYGRILNTSPLTSPLFPETLSSSEMIVPIDNQELSPLLPLSSPLMSPLGSIASLPPLYATNTTYDDVITNEGHNETSLSSVTLNLKNLTVGEMSPATEIKVVDSSIYDVFASESSITKDALVSYDISHEKGTTSQSTVRKHLFDSTDMETYRNEDFDVDEDFDSLLPSGWSLPDSLFRLSLFLTTEKEHILYKLMKTVTIHTINHENICCLNTALMMFIFAQRRYVRIVYCSI